MNQILYSEKVTNNSVKKVVILLIILLIVLFGVLFGLSKYLSGKILANVYIGDVDVGLKSKEDAIAVITSEISKIDEKKIRLTFENKYVDVTSEDIGFSAENDAEYIVEDAYSYGRDGNVFKNTVSMVKSYFKNTIVTPSYKFNEIKLTKILKALTSGDSNVASDDSYEISGDKIYIYKGSDGAKIDTDLAKEYITTAFLNDVDVVTLPTIEKETQKIDLDKIYSEVYVSAQNASFSSENGFEVVIEKEGKTFDLASAKTNYENLSANQSMVIDIKIIEPEVKVADLESKLFSNVLATYSTTYDQKDTNRVQNLRVAAERCNNTILYPGEEFSYNKALGTRTVANGYAPGHSFAGGKVVTTIGGGICQVSSTLYNVVLMANLEVTNRVAHGMYVEYVKPSLDATVVDGSIDFNFKNDRKYPIKIEATAENGVVKVSILGIKDENEPIVEIESVILETLEYKTVKENDSSMKKGTTKVTQEPVNGYVSEAYKILKDSTGKEISRTLISKDRYTPTNEIIKVGTKEEVIIQTPEVPTETETPETPETPSENEKELPPGWDSPESPYANGNY